MTSGPDNPWLVAAVLGGLAYPLVVYYGSSLVTPMVLVLAGLALIGVRLLGLRRLAWRRSLGAALLSAAAGMIGLSLLSVRLAAQSYPVMVSLSVAVAFAISLRAPPTIVERLARLRHRDLPPAGVAYCRSVTVVWVCFLVMNAAISTATGLWGSLAQWTLWNGLLSYIAMGVLFAGEWLVRRSVMKKRGWA